MKNTFNKRVNEALADEHKAPKDYMRLKKLAKSKLSKKQITSIANQERKHFKKLRKIKKRENLIKKRKKK